MMEYKIITYDYEDKKPKKKLWLIILIVLGILFFVVYINAQSIKNYIQKMPMFMNEHDKKNYETEQYFKTGRTYLDTGYRCTDAYYVKGQINYNGDIIEGLCMEQCAKINKNVYSSKCNANKIYCDCK